MSDLMYTVGKGYERLGINKELSSWLNYLVREWGFSPTYPKYNFKAKATGYPIRALIESS